MILDQDTIAAIATAPGRGGVGIIRISGSNARQIGMAVTASELQSRHAHFATFRDRQGKALDSGIALFFPGPHSFTGEDVVELQAHGGPVILDLLLNDIYARGARQARPGEFSERAFLNNKIDLAQAEAIADLINSTTEQAALNATRSLQGEFSRKIDELVAMVTRLRVYVEAAIDFPEEEIDFLADERVTAKLKSLLSELEQVIETAHQGQLLREGMRIVLAGQPNTGKSSLLNALAGRETAIVTEVPGTTRDVLKEEISIDGLPLHIIDTAGLRDSGDIVEQEGIRRTWQEIEQADCVLLLLDDRTGFGESEQLILDQLPHQLPVTRVYNKIDLTGAQVELVEDESSVKIKLSAKSGQGIELLRDHLKTRVGYHGSGEGLFMARRRHLDALERAKLHIEKGYEKLQTHHAGELLAEELRLAQLALGEITGEVSSDELLGRIFSSFCIGK